MVAPPGIPGMPQATPIPGMGMQNMGMPGAPPPPAPGRDAMLDMASLRDMMAQSQPIGPVYPRWLGEIKQPDPAKMIELARRKFDDYAKWRGAVRHDMIMVRMAETGIFPDDKEYITSGIMEPFESTGLVDEYNLAVSWLSGLERRVVKNAQSDETKGDARKVKLACQLLLEYEARCHTSKGEMPSRIVEPKVLLGSGLLAKRRVLDRFAEPYDSPFITRYIDPTQLIAEFDDRPGPSRIFRVYSSTVGEVARTYGDFTDSVRKKLETKYGRFDDDLELTNIVEYWDRWWRFVGIESDDILPLVDHRYGEVPYTIGYGPHGEPNLTMLPETSGAASVVDQMWRDNMPYKCVPYVRFGKRTHIQMEAFMTRMMYGVKVEIDPPYIRERSTAAGNKPAPGLDPSPGAANETMLGEEKITPFPFPATSQSNRMLLLDALKQDMTTGRAPLSAYGQMDQSNISGTANKQAAQAGLHLWKPWVQSLEEFHSMDLSKAMRIWQRLGNVIEYGERGTRRPFVVPVQKPYSGESASFELKRETIAKVGANVSVAMASVNPEDWFLRFQTMEMGNKQGFSTAMLTDHLLGIDYDPQMFEEWQEEQAIKQAMQHPRFLELVVIPSMLDSQIAENEDDPEQLAVLMHYREMWEQLQVQPAMIEHQMKMQQMQAMPGPGEAQPDASGMPPTTSGVSLPELGSGPGSVTGNQGGPRGPYSSGGGE